MSFWRGKSYDEVPALSIRRQHLRRALRTMTLAVMFAVVFSAATNGSHVPIFARMVGFSDFDLGLMAALPHLVAFGQLAGAAIVESSGLTKFLFIYCGAAHRLLWIAVALVPLLLPVPSRLAAGAMLAAIGLSQLLWAFAQPPMNVWMGDLVPRRIRGRYFANRQIYSRPVTIACAIGLGLVLDWATRPGLPQTAAQQPLLLGVIVVIFIIAALSGTTDLLLFLRIREVVRGQPRPKAPPQPLSLAWAARRVHESLISPLADKAFRRYAAFNTTLAFAASVSGFFFIVNCLENLHFSKLATNFLFLVISPVLGLIGASRWGKLVDRWGRRPVLILATFGTCFSVIPWFLASDRTPAPPYVAQALNAATAAVGGLIGHGDWRMVDGQTPLGAYLVACFSTIIGGVSWTGIWLGQQAVTMGFSDGPGRSRYIAAAAVMAGVGGLVGGLVGGTVAQQLSGLAIRLGPFLWNQWHATFAISEVGRIAALLLLIGMPDQGSGRMRDLLLRRPRTALPQRAHGEFVR